MVVVLPPSFDLSTRIVQRGELADVQAFVAQSSVERFYVPVFIRLSRTNEIELDTATPSPVLERLGHELGAVIHRDRDRCSGLVRYSFQGCCDAAA